MSLDIRTSVDLPAARQVVWEVLTDFASYRQWNPHMTIEGAAEVGTRLRVRLTAADGRGMSFRPRVLVAEPGEQLRWVGTVGGGILARGEHYFELSANADGSTHLEHGELYSGLLVTLTRHSVASKPDADEGYRAFNAALARRLASRPGLS